jgi:glutamate-5-semialdehyde dehydrogenase
MNTKQANVRDLARESQNASRELSNINADQKNEALTAIANTLRDNREEIMAANQSDLDTARDEGLSEAMLDRLQITPDRLDSMIDGILDVVELDDPVGEIIDMKERPNGLKVGRQRVPLGVIGMIYESRPNVTVDAGVLCLKSGNAILLRGGSEAKKTNYLLVDLMQDAIAPYLPESSISILRDQSHDLVDELLSLDDKVDVIIPRGGEKLIDTVAQKSTIPVIKHYEGICHVYVSEEADPEMAMSISLNAKTQRTSVCNAMETLLLHENLSDKLINNLLTSLADEDVELRLSSELQTRIGEINTTVKEATEDDWETEYLDSILSVRTVESTESAIDHINTYGNHSDAIVTEDYTESQHFLDQVDSAAVYVNASTRFTDGYEFGLGAEIGISTDRLHCRGPMGLRELTIPKYVVYGQGQVRT